MIDPVRRNAFQHLVRVGGPHLVGASWVVRRDVQVAGGLAVFTSSLAERSRHHHVTGLRGLVLVQGERPRGQLVSVHRVVLLATATAEAQREQDLGWVLGNGALLAECEVALGRSFDRRVNGVAT